MRSSADSMPDRQPDERGRHGERRIRGRRVRHPRRVLDEALDAAEALGELPDLRARDEVDRLLLVLEEERDHPAEVAHLPRGDRVAGVRGQAGVEDALDARVPLEERGDGDGVRAVAIHPHGERLHAAQDEPRVERSGHGAERLLEERELLADRVVVRRDEAADDVRVAAEVLRRRVERRRRHRARAAAGGTASRTCCRRPRARRPRVRPPTRRRCRRCSAPGSSASRARRASSARRGDRRGRSRSPRA